MLKVAVRVGNQCQASRRDRGGVVGDLGAPWMENVQP